MTDDELKELVAGLAVSQAKTDELQKKNEEQFARTDATLERIGIRLGNISDNNGSSVEDYFFNSLADKPELGGIGYDTIVKNFVPKSRRCQGEFDIVLYNGENIALIECKYKAHKTDVEKLITKQVDSFKKLFPIYAKHKFYLGIASFSFYPELEKFARENGVAILKQKGDVVEIQADYLKVF